MFLLFIGVVKVLKYKILIIAFEIFMALTPIENNDTFTGMIWLNQHIGRK